MAAHVKPLTADSNDTGEELQARVTQTCARVCVCVSASVQLYMPTKATSRYSVKGLKMHVHSSSYLNVYALADVQYRALPSMTVHLSYQCNMLETDACEQVRWIRSVYDLTSAIDGLLIWISGSGMADNTCDECKALETILGISIEAA